MKYLFLILLMAIGLQGLAQNVHVVQRGETAERIAEKYGISEELLRSTNPQLKAFYVGAKVKIPEKPKKTNVNPPMKTQGSMGAGENVRSMAVAQNETSSRNSTSKANPVSTRNSARSYKNERRQRRLEKWKRGFDIAGAVLSATSNVAMTMATGSPQYQTTTMPFIKTSPKPEKRSQEDQELLEELRRSGRQKFETRKKPDGTIESWLYYICYSCHGEGRCKLYLGDDIRKATLSYHDRDCLSCHGTNECSFCYGKGWRLQYNDGSNPPSESQAPTKASTTESNTEQSRPLKVCWHCNGTGLEPGDESVGNFWDKPYVYCQVCGRKHRETTGHKKCSRCDGVGKTDY